MFSNSCTEKVEGIACRQKEHAEAMVKKQELKEEDELAKGMEDIYTKLLQELRQSEEGLCIGGKSKEIFVKNQAYVIQG